MFIFSVYVDCFMFRAKPIEISMSILHSVTAMLQTCWVQISHSASGFYLL